jgi:hypothetical protein
MRVAARLGWTVPAWVSHPWTPMCALILVFALQRQSDIVTHLLAVILVSVVSRPWAILNNSVARYLGAISYSSTFAMATRAMSCGGGSRAELSFTIP